MSKRWTREHLLLALNLYHQTPFGRQHQGYPPIIELADKLERTPGSVAMKLNNFTSLDPAETSRGIKGLQGSSRLDRVIWEEFYGHLDELAEQSELLIDSFGTKPMDSTAISPPAGESETTALVKVRRHQQFFRKAVLGSYEQKCCISGIPVLELLRASHIIPWSDHAEHRTDPANGLCLAATYDAAFDKGLIALSGDFTILVSDRLKQFKNNQEIETHFLSREHTPITLPAKNLPNPEFLEWHRTHRFLG
ncbi:putative restriction endonuclease [Rubritalea squalenifaciens DSM 18772]|uniref:Putative restriction endonuclease n=1 Tax=Rubritalea squalenifaciens DSM 18772 TaxID=1123071 RepID=A0A1M6D1P4_9BACT|nr:HNH endonuclease [Rubritalea squalenifaciens]SHI67182.1 putative restriction endonuclease [Rubritalea squalenifaciens DSM 18772]